MKTRIVRLTLAIVLALVVGCNQPPNPPSDEPAKEAVEVPQPVASFGLPLAPAPRAKGEPAPAPPANIGTVSNLSRPWQELIVGKWLYVNGSFGDIGYQGQKVRGFTRDGKVIEHYSCAAAPNRPKGIERLSGAKSPELCDISPAATMVIDCNTSVYDVAIGRR